MTGVGVNEIAPGTECVPCCSRDGRGSLPYTREGSDGLAYIEEGWIATRLESRRRETNAPGSRRTPQESVFTQLEEPEFAFVEREWEAHQRLELEIDRIAAHTLGLG